MGVSLKQVFDIDQILSIMTLPEVKSKAFSGNVDLFTPIVNSESGWFIGINNGQLVGIINAIQINPVTIEFHPYSINKLTSRELIKSFYGYFLKTPREVNKLICMIPECFPKTVNLALRTGFIDEGYLKESYNRDNKLYGVRVFGITKQEIEAFLNG